MHPQIFAIILPLVYNVEMTLRDVYDTAADININDLAVVHCTRFKPISTEQGWIVHSRSHGSNLRSSFRPTIHTTMNHAVQSHELGSWDDVPFIVIAPMKNMVDRNGVPVNFSKVDTFWAPGDGKLLFDDGVLLRANRGNKGELFTQISGNEYSFKASDFSLEDFNQITGLLDLDWDNPKTLNYSLQGNKFYSSFERGLQEKFGWEYSDTEQNINLKTVDFWKSLQAQCRDAAKTGRNTSLFYALGEAGFTGMNRYNQLHRDIFSKQLFSDVRDFSTQKVLALHGFKTMPGGKYDYSEESKKFALELGTDCKSHLDTSYSALEYRINSVLLKIVETGIKLREQGIDYKTDPGFLASIRASFTKIETLFSDDDLVMDDKARKTFRDAAFAHIEEMARDPFVPEFVTHLQS